MSRLTSFLTLVWVLMLAGCGHPPLAVLQSRSDECYANKQFEHSRSFAEEAATVAHEIPNVEQEGLCLERVGRAYWALNQYQKALDAYDKALDIWLKNPSMWVGVPRTQNARGGVLIELKRFDEAEDALKKASRYCFGEGIKEPIFREKMKDFRNISYRIERLALVARKKGEDPAKWYEYGIEEMNKALAGHPSMTYTVQTHTAHILKMWKTGLGEKPDAERLKRYEAAVEAAKARGVKIDGEGSEFPIPDPLRIPPVRSDAGA